MLSNYEIPIAYSMIALAQKSLRFEHQPFQDFMCYWTAFNNIYTTIAERKGHIARLKTQKDGTIRTRSNGSVQIPEVEKALTEHEEIVLTFGEFTETLKHELIIHPNTRFFVYRSPHWHGRPMEFDGSGQKLNGVLNVKYTVDAEHPVWSPIDIQTYERYMEGMSQKGYKDLLAKQILFLIYTVRNNAFHGGKRADDANDREVILKILPLLTMIVNHFVHPE